jgi:hypothetical protein
MIEIYYKDTINELMFKIEIKNEFIDSFVDEFIDEIMSLKQQFQFITKEEYNPKYDTMDVDILDNNGIIIGVLTTKSIETENHKII